MNSFVVATGVLLAVTATPYLAYAGLYLAVHPRGSPAEKRAVEPTVSVVLPTFNEETIVERKLEDICAQDYPMDRIEVVAVDASSDDTVDIIEDFFVEREHPELKLLEEEERRGLAVALNDAYEEAEGDVVVKTDCDSLLAEDAVREAVANLADPDVGAVTGRNVEVLGGSAVEAGYRNIQAAIQTLESHLDSTLIFHGPFSAFKNDAIVSLDPNSLADDTELALRIRRTRGFDGGRVVFDPDIRYKEAAHSSFVGRRMQKDRRAMGLIRLLFQHRDAVGRHGRYGRVVLPFNWWFMVVSPWLVLLGLFMVTVLAGLLGGLVGALMVPLGLVGFTVLGARDRLGPLQPLYSLFDTQVSLFQGATGLLLGRGDGTWEVDMELREAFE